MKKKTTTTELEKAKQIMAESEFCQNWLFIDVEELTSNVELKNEYTYKEGYRRIED